MADLVGRALPHLRELAAAARCAARYPTGLTDLAVPALGAGTVTELSGRTDLETPVVLIHGYGHNRSAWHELQRALRGAGFHTVHAINHDPLRYGTLALAEQLAEHVDATRGATGAARVHVVGHSLGGLVVRAFVHLLGGDQCVDTAVTIATPHCGSHAARLGFGATATDIRPGSRLLQRLDAGAFVSPVRFVAYWSRADLLVRPAGSGRLEHPAIGAENIGVHDTGHLGLLVSPRVTASITEHLRTPVATAPPAVSLSAARAG